MYQLRRETRVSRAMLSAAQRAEASDSSRGVGAEGGWEAEGLAPEVVGEEGDDEQNEQKRGDEVYREVEDLRRAAL